MRYTLICLAVACPGAFAQAGHTVFGLRISQPLAAEKCATTPSAGFTLAPKTGFCIESLRQNNNDEAGLQLRFAFGELPVWVKGSGLRVTTVGQKVEAVTVLTGGSGIHTVVMDALVAKYGPVQSKTPGTVKTRMGVEYDATIYAWQSDAVTVQYTPVLGQPDEGMLTVTTAAGRDANRRSAEALKRQFEGRTSL